MKPYVVGFIFARGGSKGVPRKNVRLLAGKPLIAYAIETANASAWIDRVVVSTDNDEIADVARRYRAEVPFIRPAALAGDDSPEWLAWQHAIRMIEMEQNERKMDIFVCIPPTSPLRAVDDLDACIRALQDSDADIVITVTPARRSPHFNMVVVDENSSAKLVIPPEERIYHRQDAPTVYDMTTVAYAARPAFILNSSSAFDGNVKAVVVPEERSLDIDTELDFKIAEFLMEQAQ